MLLGILALLAAPAHVSAQSSDKIASMKFPDVTIILASTLPAGEFPRPGALDAVAQGPRHPN
jgi:hypothetical protein